MKNKLKKIVISIFLTNGINAEELIPFVFEVSKHHNANYVPSLLVDIKQRELNNTKEEIDAIKNSLFSLSNLHQTDNPIIRKAINMDNLEDEIAKQYEKLVFKHSIANELSSHLQELQNKFNNNNNNNNNNKKKHNNYFSTIFKDIFKK